jgi:hypothetical protein
VESVTFSDGWSSCTFIHTKVIKDSSKIPSL